VEDCIGKLQRVLEETDPVAGNERTAEGSGRKVEERAVRFRGAVGGRRHENQTQGNEVWNVSKARKGRSGGTMIIAESRLPSPVPALNRRPPPPLKCWCRRLGWGGWGQVPQRSGEFYAGGLSDAQYPADRERYFFLQSVPSLTHSRA
jgi:hypothetical protein